MASRLAKVGEHGLVVWGAAAFLWPALTSDNPAAAVRSKPWSSGVLVLVLVIFSAAAIHALFRRPDETLKTYRLPSRNPGFFDRRPARWLLELIHCDRVSRRRRTESRIAADLIDLISDASRATIITRDMSWLKGAELDGLASTGALKLVVMGVAEPPPFSTVGRLVSLGAAMHRIPFEVPVRATLTQRAGGATLAIGQRSRNHDKHVVRYVSDEDDPSFAAMKALIELAPQS